MTQWTPEGAQERYDKAMNRPWGGAHNPMFVTDGIEQWARYIWHELLPDFKEALTHIATLTAQQRAWEEERAGLVTMLRNPLALWLPPDAVTTALEWMARQEIPCSCGGGKIEWDTNAWVHEDDCEIGLSEHAAATLGYWIEFMAARERVIAAAEGPTATEGE